MKGENAIVLALGSGKKKPKPEEEDEDMSEPDIEVDEDLVTAAKAVRSASSDEEYAKALKGFIKLCKEEY